MMTQPGPVIPRSAFASETQLHPQSARRGQPHLGRRTTHHVVAPEYSRSRSPHVTVSGKARTCSPPNWKSKATMHPPSGSRPTMITCPNAGSMNRTPKRHHQGRCAA